MLIFPSERFCLESKKARSTDPRMQRCMPCDGARVHQYCKALSPNSSGGFHAAYLCVLPDRVYPLWLLPCTDACSSNSRCFWHRAKLLRFGLDANRDPEYLEGSGTAGFYSGSNALGKVFTPALPNTTWAEMRGYLNNSAEEHLWKKRQVNEEVWRLGGELKWARIDAYQLTWSNLFHFSGDFQCSCHFHRTTFNLASGEYIISGEQTQAQVNEVVDIMRVNMEKVLERDAKLAQLDDRAAHLSVLLDALQAGASQFEASAGKLKNKYWWKNMKV
ncbi:Vesicle-associated membrane protein 2 [Echinococcus granulosus]|uniref:Vesicle-associated membrane protein 2 n=1 Tax=Echinococcus granulosus TaxID=6210 RepID=W6UJC9_ECHGR|nr:Vesicle-associated membrane protein 2 [Echinococcus granulosus]EUB61246.1 Vesicle-associated membrane protein 2 [Echinococcus granulosus]